MYPTTGQYDEVVDTFKPSGVTYINTLPSLGLCRTCFSFQYARYSKQKYIWDLVNEIATPILNECNCWG